jgi:hypothetical protein
MQQVGGSIGVSALSTVALSATASYLATHRDAGRLVTPDAAIHGYTVAFTVAAIVFAVAAVLAFGLLPSRQRQQPGGSLEGAGVTGEPAHHPRTVKSPLSDDAPPEARMQPLRPAAPQTASGVRTDGGTMTLLGLTPHTIYFSGRPQRIVGHLTTHRFLQWWSEGDDSFAADPPNAVLAWGEPGTDTPATAGPCVLFIDPLGRPLSPVSVAGVRRRELRRDRRRF